MNLQRKIERNQLKEQWKEHNETVPKKQRAEFKGFWNWYRKRKRDEKNGSND